MEQPFAYAPKLEKYLVEYHKCLQQEFAFRHDHHLQWHGEKTNTVMTFLCSDGAITFYAKAPLDKVKIHGFNVKYLPENTLDQVCQSLHVHHFKILDPLIGTPVDHSCYVIVSSV